MKSWTTVGVVVFALLTACSSGSDKQAAPTTLRPTATTTEGGGSSDCADVFRVGHSPPAFPEALGVCLDANSAPLHVVSKPTRCADGTTLYRNQYGWWTTSEHVVHRNPPPQEAVDACRRS